MKSDNNPGGLLAVDLLEILDEPVDLLVHESEGSVVVVLLVLDRSDEAVSKISLGIWAREDKVSVGSKLRCRGHSYRD